MKRIQATEHILEIDRLLETFFYKPIIFNLVERYGIENLKDMGYFLKDAPSYLDDESFMGSGLQELVQFRNEVICDVLPHIDDALLVSPFQYNNIAMTEEEYLYRRMLSHVFKDNVDLLSGLVDKLTLLYPVKIPLTLTAPELVYREASKEKVRARA